MKTILVATLLLAGGSAFLVERSAAQSPARTPPVVEATLAQLMRGIIFPASNVIFAAQSQNPDDVPPAKDPATATNPLASTYGKWTAVENSGLAIAESANLLTIAGRKCSIASMDRSGSSMHPKLEISPGGRYPSRRGSPNTS